MNVTGLHWWSVNIGSGKSNCSKFHRLNESENVSCKLANIMQPIFSSGLVEHNHCFFLFKFPLSLFWRMKLTGPWFNIKMLSYQYRKSHCGDKTVVRSSYLHNGISYTGKMVSLYWIRAQDVITGLGYRKAQKRWHWQVIIWTNHVLLTPIYINRP